MQPQLRPYQQRVKDDVLVAWQSVRGALAVMPTGAGKTTLFSNILAEEPAYSVAIAHRSELVTQMSLTLARYGVRHRVIGSDATAREASRLHMGEIGRNYVDPSARAAVASVDTLVRVNPDEPWIAATKLVVIDECFPAGTMVSGRPIESLRPGDTVDAFNETTGQIEQREVVRLFRNPMPKHMMRVETTAHHVLECTNGHPFYTRSGWKNAADLTTNDEVLTYELHELRRTDNGDGRTAAIPLQENGAHLLQHKMRHGVSGSASQNAGERNETPRNEIAESNRPVSEMEPRADRLADCTVFNVRNAGRIDRIPADVLENAWAGVLRDGMLDGVPFAEIIRDDGRNESQICIGAHAGEQSDARSGGTGEDERNVKGDESRAENTRREWAIADDPRDGVRNAIRSFGICDSPRNQNGTTARVGVSARVQAGPSALRNDDSDRGGRHESRGAETPRREERRVLTWVRLDSVTVLERGNNESAGTGNCDGHVYNIEVADLHTYIANGVVVHNCHHVRSGNKWVTSAEMFRNARVLGVTATPFRADGAGLGSHADGIFDTMIVGPSMRELIDTGSLCEYRIFAPPNAVNLADVALSASGDYSPAPLRDAVHKAHITGDIVSHYLKLARNKLAIVFTVDIETSVEAAESFRAAGVAAEVISGKTPAALRNAIMRKFRNREIHVLCNCDVLGEGTDVPAVECVVMARPTMSRGLYIQQFGRALRPMDGKERALIIDAVGNVVRHGLPDAPMSYTLDRRERRSKGAPVDAIPLRTCLNPDVDGSGIPCAQPYERAYRCCPYCGHYPEPAARSSIEAVDGDLHELDEATLSAMRGAIARVDGAPLIPGNLPPEAVGAIKRRHWERQQAVAQLRDTMQLWGGLQTDRNGRELHEAQRAFYLTFGLDVATAQTLNRADAEALSVRVRNDLIKQGVTL